MKCALCNEREADKKNTHYLTDGVIRTCLNLDGNIEREKGFYFNVSNDSEFLAFNFQRETSIKTLQEALGREPTEEEISKARKIPFSVDNVFCSLCEAKFTEIESSFIVNFLSKLRNSDISRINEWGSNNIKFLRLFFYLQVWRTSVCEEIFYLDSITKEKLRGIIFENTDLTNNDLNEFPLSITYLETLGDAKEYTRNYIGFTNDRNPNIIFMNDFVIQFYQNAESIRFLDLYNLNKIEDLKHFINYKEDNFKIKIIHNEERKEFLILLGNVKVEMTIRTLDENFIRVWCSRYGSSPTIGIRQKYITTIIGNDKFNVLKYSKETIDNKTTEFIQRKGN
jgi:hypothetical protein